QDGGKGRGAGGGGEYPQHLTGFRGRGAATPQPFSCEATASAFLAVANRGVRDIVWPSRLKTVSQTTTLLKHRDLSRVTRLPKLSSSFARRQQARGRQRFVGDFAKDEARL